MNQKRRNDDSLDESEDKTTKKTKSDSTVQPKLIASPSQSTKLIYPGADLDLMDKRNIFMKRIVRPISCDLRVQFPNLLEDETLHQLESLKNQFKGQEPKPKIKNSQSKKVSRKENLLIRAAYYLFEEKIKPTVVAKLTKLTAYEVYKLRKNLLNGKNVLEHAPSSRRKLNSTHIQFLDTIMKSGDSTRITVETVKQKLLENFPEITSISDRTILRALYRLGYSYKKVTKYPEARNNDQVKKERKIVTQKLVYSVYKDYDVIFVDETMICLNFKPSYGWGLKGKKLSVAAPLKPFNYSLIAAVTCTDVLGCKLIKGGARKEDYLSFVYEVIRQHNYDKNSQNLVIFADNAPIHHAKQVKENLLSRVTLLYNASYSPMLNPIEEFFAKFKGLIKKMPTKDESDLVQSVQTVLTKFSSNDLKGFFRHALSFMEKALQDEDLL